MGSLLGITEGSLEGTVIFKITLSRPARRSVEKWNMKERQGKRARRERRAHPVSGEGREGRKTQLEVEGVLSTAGLLVYAQPNP